MAAPIDFYFDFSSPLWLLSRRLESPRSPRSMGAAWCGGRPARRRLHGDRQRGRCPRCRSKGPYSMRDMARTARFLGIQFKLPDPFPVSTQAAARGPCTGLEQQAPDQIEPAVLALYRAYFVDGRDISSPETTADVLATLGHERVQGARCAEDPRDQGASEARDSGRHRPWRIRLALHHRRR